MAQAFTVDVNTIGGAVQSLLSNTKRSLNVPGASTSASPTVGYSFNVSSSLRLDADWTLFDGFVLNNVTLCEFVLASLEWLPSCLLTQDSTKTRKQGLDQTHLVSACSAAPAATHD